MANETAAYRRLKETLGEVDMRITVVQRDLIRVVDDLDRLSALLASAVGRLPRVPDHPCDVPENDNG